MRVQGWWRIGSAAALAAVFAGVTLPASAQVTSEKRIPVKKESGGDVARKDSIARADSIAAAARADSVAMMQARYDSLARAEAAYRDSVARAEQALRDSIARAELARAEQARLDSIARADSVKNAAALAAASAAAIPPAMSRRGFYIGLAGGWSTPTGDLDGPYSDGWNVTVPFGWQKVSSRFGLRADIAYDSHGGASYTGTAVPPVVNPNQTVPQSTLELNDNSVWSGNLDLTLDVFQWGGNKTGSVYLLGGIGVHFFDSPKVTITPLAGTPAPTTVEGDSQTEFGFNGGGGIGLPVGRASLFLESRFFTADTPNVTAQWVPVIIGIRWF